MRVLILAFALTGFLTGCSWLKGGEDNAEPPAELTSIEQQVTLTTLWKKDIGGGIKEQFLRLTPIVDGGRLFAVNHDGNVVALDAATGKQVWEAETRAAVTSGAGVGEGLVLVGTADAEVVALNWQDGEEVWRAQVSSEVLAAPTAAEGLVVVQSVDGNLAALDAATGERRWVFDRTVPVLSLRGTSSPLLVPGGVLSGLANGKLVAIGLKRGLPAWETTIAIPSGRSELDRMVDIDSAPQVWGNQVYTVTYQGRVAALNGADGQIQWARDMSSAVGLSIDFRQVYVTDEQSHVWALDRRNGASMWSQDALYNRALTRPVAFGDTVAVADFEGYLHLLSRIDGEIVGRTRVDDAGVLAPPIVVDDILYVYGNSGTLAAYRLGER